VRYLPEERDSVGAPIFVTITVAFSARAVAYGR